MVKGRPEAERETERSGVSQRPLTIRSETRSQCFKLAEHRPAWPQIRSIAAFVRPPRGLITRQTRRSDIGSFGDVESTGPLRLCVLLERAGTQTSSRSPSSRHEIGVSDGDDFPSPVLQSVKLGTTPRIRAR